MREGWVMIFLRGWWRAGAAVGVEPGDLLGLVHAGLQGAVGRENAEPVGGGVEDVLDHFVLIDIAHGPGFEGYFH